MDPAEHRFGIARAKWVKPLLWLVGATPAKSYVTLDPQQLRARFGFYELVVPMERITRVERSAWPWYGGIGIRTNLRDTIGLTGTYDNIVRLDIDPPIRASVLKIPVNLTMLYISVDDPDRFLETFQVIRNRTT